MATLIGLTRLPREEKLKRKKTKISGGQGRANKEGREWGRRSRRLTTVITYWSTEEDWDSTSNR